MSHRVLVLDNDPSLGELLALALRRSGLRPLVLSASADAETVMTEEGADFLVLDLNLGAGDSGDRLARRWAGAGILPPFLILTGTPLDERLDSLRGLPEFRGVLAKPFSLVALADEIRAGCGPARLGESA
ncbi:MAG: hypothetical protein ISR76_02155 [Planctomycetes bacterium]|nr:hypothetical protein [Planctomycetota bacterium]MBL7007771.1 hypothetical protein [Planctomycetota bacterium]